MTLKITERLRWVGRVVVNVIFELIRLIRMIGVSELVEAGAKETHVDLQETHHKLTTKHSKLTTLTPKSCNFTTNRHEDIMKPHPSKV
jgi:hypothetical protein